MEIDEIGLEPLWTVRHVVCTVGECGTILDAARVGAGMKERRFMDEILRLAAKLGTQIGNDPKGKAMAEARVQLEGSLTDRQLLSDYEASQQKLHTLEESGKPIEPDDKRRLSELHGKVISSPIIKGLLKAQADYMELMTVVSQTIEDAALDVMEGVAETPKR